MMNYTNSYSVRVRISAVILLALVMSVGTYAASINISGPVPGMAAISGPVPGMAAISGPVPGMGAISGPVPGMSAISGPVPGMVR
jgi:hypothetical protein